MDKISQEAKLAGLQHENLQIRSLLLSLFADDREPGEGVAMHAIRQIEKYGWRNAFEFPSKMTKLPHTEESVKWLATWLKKSASEKNQREQQLHLCKWFNHAPVKWLLPEIGRFVQTSKTETGAGPITSNPISFANPEVSFAHAMDRLEASMWTGAKCREELDQLLERCAASDDFPHDEIRRMEVLCEALAKHGNCNDEALGSWLDLADLDPEREIDLADYRAGAAMRIIHHGKLHPPVAKIVRLFELDWDWLNELTEDALVSGGDQDTLRDLLGLFPTHPWHARLYLCSALEHLRFEGFEVPLIELLRSEEADDLRVRLAHVLALYGGPDAIIVAKEIATESPDSAERQEILNVICVEEILAGRESHETRKHLQNMVRRYQERQIRFGDLDRLLAKASSQPTSIESEPLPFIPAAPRPPVGRNEPCPCGSGKKYKKCCGAG